MRPLFRFGSDLCSGLTWPTCKVRVAYNLCPCAPSYIPPDQDFIPELIPPWNIFLDWNHNIFVGLVPMQIFGTLWQPLLCFWTTGLWRKENFRWRWWGPRFRVYARSTLRLAFCQHQQKFSRARVFRVAFKHLPQSLRSHIQSFWTLGYLLKLPLLSAQKCRSSGGRGVPDFFFIGIMIFL